MPLVPPIAIPPHPVVVPIVDSAPVAHISRDVGSFGAGEGARIEVFVGSGDLPGVLAALDGRSVLSVVGAPSVPAEDGGQ